MYKSFELISTEDDKTNCPFYFKIGACRHGDKCVRVHNKPIISEVLLLKDFYKHSTISIAIVEGQKVSEEALKQDTRDFEDFYEKIFLEFMNYGRIEEINVLENLGEHMLGNVYIKFSNEKEAEAALNEISKKYIGGKPIICEYSPVIDFRESRCRQYDEGSCRYGGYCNFMHIKYISSKWKKMLEKKMFHEFPEYKNQESRNNIIELNDRERMRLIRNLNDELKYKKSDEQNLFNKLQNDIDKYLTKQGYK